MPPRARAFAGLSTLDAIATACLVAHLLLFSRLLELAPQGQMLRSIAIVLILGGSLAGVCAAAAYGHLRVAAISAAGLLAVWAYVALYAARSGQPFTATAGGLYFAIGLPSLLYMAILKNRIDNIIKILYAAIVIYAVLYIAASLALRFGLIAPAVSSEFAISADEMLGRQARIPIATAYIIFGLSYSVVKLFRKERRLAWIAVAIFAATLYFANSRAITGIAVAAALVYVLSRSARVVTFGAAMIFAAITCASLWILLNPEIDLSTATRDISLRVRILSVDIVRDHFPSAWLLGAGLPTGGAGYVHVTSSPTFFPADVGLIGIAFSFGLIGLTGYVTLVFVTLLNWRVPGLSQATQDAFGITVASLAVWTIIAPAYIGASAGAIAALLVASGMAKSRTRQEAHPRIRNRSD